MTIRSIGFIAVVVVGLTSCAGAAVGPSLSAQEALDFGSRPENANAYHMSIANDTYETVRVTGCCQRCVLKAPDVGDIQSGDTWHGTIETDGSSSCVTTFSLIVRQLPLHRSPEGAGDWIKFAPSGPWNFRWFPDEYSDFGYQLCARKSPTAMSIQIYEAAACP